MLKHELRQRREEERQRRALILAVVVFALALAAYFLSQSEPVQRRYLYPYPYQELVELYAKANGVDSALVASVIMNESRFQNDARSPRGAIGLMQIMPETAQWIAVQLGDDNFSLEKLREPETNIRYGVWYLAELQREFAGNNILALAAYNAGRGTVRDWIEEGDWPWTFHALDKIPYPETRSYVKNVLQNRIRYEKLYSGKHER
ncbi:MAG: lytic transglycosylase domain-containing protein [Negativicutes bacterium]